MAKKKNEKSNFDIYDENIEVQKKSINNKINSLEQKLISLQNKESIINSLILKINQELENTDPKHFKAISQIRNVLNRQFETLSLITDMIIKVEDMVQKYRKMLIEIENKKIDNFIKLNKETASEENDLSILMTTLNDNFKNIGNTSNNQNPLIEDAMLELKDSGY